MPICYTELYSTQTQTHHQTAASFIGQEKKETRDRRRKESALDTHIFASVATTVTSFANSETEIQDASDRRLRNLKSPFTPMTTNPFRPFLSDLLTGGGSFHALGGTGDKTDARRTRMTTNEPNLGGTEIPRATKKGEGRGEGHD